MAQALAIVAAGGAGSGIGAAAGSILSSIMRTLVEIAKMVARFLLELMKWFRETILSDPWRMFHFFGSMAILML